MMTKDRKNCFLRGGYDLVNSRVIVQFSDDSIYAYDGLTMDQWMNWKEAYPHGVYFDHYYRYSEIRFTRLDSYPADLWFPFVEILKSLQK